MKKLLLVFALAGFAIFPAVAQVSVEVVTEQDQFLPSETVPVAVKITNRSGQPLHLGVNPNWLTFDVEADDGFIVAKYADVPVLGEFDLGSSQVATKRVDLKPYFNLTRPGRYKITATLRIKDWGLEQASRPKSIDVISGAKIWAQSFGLPVPSGMSNTPPEVRKYTLEKANYLRSQLRLYVQVSDDSESHVFNVVSVGKMVSFSEPEAQLDRVSNLHVLWQSGSSFFTYAEVNPNGELVKHEIFDYVTARPRLVMNDDGAVTVVGGVRRLAPSEMPMVMTPDQVPPAPAAAPAVK
jgi:hypothetical protein